MRKVYHVRDGHRRRGRADVQYISIGLDAFDAFNALNRSKIWNSFSDVDDSLVRLVRLGHLVRLVRHGGDQCSGARFSVTSILQACAPLGKGWSATNLLRRSEVRPAHHCELIGILRGGLNLRKTS